jgi:PAS domain S-box-containing protein
MSKISEQKRAEEKLKLFSQAIEEAMDGVQITDLDGRIIYSNKAIEEIYGFSASDFLGKHVGEMNADKEFAGKVIIPGIRETGRWNGEVMVLHRDGRAFPIWLSASIVKDDRGEPMAMLGIIRDITLRKLAEQDRENLIHKLNDALANIKTLKGLLPICAWCNKIRDDKGYWNRVETYIKERSDASFTHCICPECLKKESPEAYDEVLRDRSELLGKLPPETE